jgi:endonuclease/exonuclease/phosphatase family metal-dependent hydrolase
MRREAGRPAVRLVAFIILVAAGATRLDAADSCALPPVVQAAAVPGNPRPGEDHLTIASLNIAGNPRTADMLATWTRERSLDVLLLQEVGGSALDGASFVETLGGRLGYSSVYAPAARVGNSETQGLAVLSRLPLENANAYALRHNRLRFVSRCRIGLAASVLTPAGPVRLMNVHLDTRINSGRRVAQLEPLLETLDEDDGAQIIGGDFNTMNVWWFWSMWPFPYLHRQAEAVQAWLAGKGFHTPFTDAPPTFRFAGFPLSLDWLYLKGFETVEWAVEPIRFTDHRGIWARIRRSQDRDPATK